MTLSLTLKTVTSPSFDPPHPHPHTLTHTLELCTTFPWVAAAVWKDSKCEQVSYTDGSVIYASADCHLVRFATSWISIQTSEGGGWGGGLYVQAITFNLIRKCLVSKQHTQEHIACAKNTTSENFGEVRDNADLIRRWCKLQTDCKHTKTQDTNDEFSVINKISQRRYLADGSVHPYRNWQKAIPCPGHAKADSH